MRAAGSALIVAAMACTACSSDTPCGADRSCPGANQICNLATLACEVHERCREAACPESARPRCAWLLVPTSPVTADAVGYQALCVESAASPLQRGQRCTVSMVKVSSSSAPYASGRDACDLGLTCVDPTGGTSGTCMKMCLSDSDCDAASEACSGRLCLPTCTPFAADCPGTCIPDFSVDLCHPPGSGRQMDACPHDVAQSCATGFACAGLLLGHFIQTVCLAVCDAAHPCAPDMTCTLPRGDVGLCL